MSLYIGKDDRQDCCKVYILGLKDRPGALEKGKELVGAEQILAGTSVSSDRTLTSGSGSPDTVALETMHAVGWDFAVSIEGVRNRLCQGARGGGGNTADRF